MNSISQKTKSNICQFCALRFTGNRAKQAYFQARLEANLKQARQATSKINRQFETQN